jgi:hypothetical protein
MPLEKADIADEETVTTIGWEPLCFGDECMQHPPSFIYYLSLKHNLVPLSHACHFPFKNFLSTTFSLFNSFVPGTCLFSSIIFKNLFFLSMTSF